MLSCGIFEIFKNTFLYRTPSGCFCNWRTSEFTTWSAIYWVNNSMILFIAFCKESPGAQWGYLKCNIRSTNNKLPNMFYKFIHLQLFNIKHEIVHLQVVWRQIFVFQKSYLSQTEENGYLWTSLISHFKLPWENDDPLYSRHK